MTGCERHWGCHLGAAFCSIQYTETGTMHCSPKVSNLHKLYASLFGLVTFVPPSVQQVVLVCLQSVDGDMFSPVELYSSPEMPRRRLGGLRSKIGQSDQKFGGASEPQIRKFEHLPSKIWVTRPKKKGYIKGLKSTNVAVVFHEDHHTLDNLGLRLHRLP